MEDDAVGMRRTFLPTYGAEARKMARSSYKAFGRGGEQIAKHVLMSGHQWQQEQTNQHRQQLSTESYLPARSSPSRSKYDAPKASHVASKLLKNSSEPSLPPRVSPSSASTLLKNSSEPSLLPRVSPNRIVHQSHQPRSSSTLRGLVAAARREIDVTELPSLDSRSRFRDQTLLPLLSPSKAEAKGTPKRCDTKLQPWSLQEESKKLKGELERLGKPQEPMKWANPEVENKWLRREATYELFKSLLSGGSPKGDDSS
jgi:hypothetical protein